MVNTKQSAQHVPGRGSIKSTRLFPKPPDDNFEDKTWSEAFHNTVFSAYCPPLRAERKPCIFTVCDFQELPPDHSGKSTYKREKESFAGNDCEERVKDHLEKVLLP
jgi:hypothetical protein